MVPWGEKHDALFCNPPPTPRRPREEGGKKEKKQLKFLDNLFRLLLR